MPQLILNKMTKETSDIRRIMIDKKKVVIQRHHIQYADEKGRQDDIVVPLYKGEHMIITRMQWRKKISKGFIKALKHWILVNEDNAVDAVPDEDDDLPTPQRV